MKIFAILLGLLLILGGCAYTSSIQKKAEFDLNCPADQITVTNLGSGNFGAKGCGNQTSYACAVDGFGRLHQCQKN